MSESAELLDNVVFRNHHPGETHSKSEILEGLNKDQKSINPKYFYDTLGSELFEKITDLPEYYPTRTERLILQKYSHEMAALCGDNCVLIEPGSGSSEKVRLLLDALKPKAYVPMDIASEFLKRAACRLAEEFPWLDVHAICSDFSQLDRSSNEIPDGKRVIFYPGSTLGNMTPCEAEEFLRYLVSWIDCDGGVLIGIDLHKNKETLHAAYNDKCGVTAEFNLNVLNNINRLMDGNFETTNFHHQAFYNTDEFRIEMHLVSRQDMQVELDGVDISFSEGETIHTENSYKYTLENFSQLVASAGLKIEASWLDDKELFSVHYLKIA